MTVDVSYIMVNVVAGILGFFVFINCYLIYKHAKGGSEAYKFWAIGTFIIFLAMIFYISCGLLIGANETSKTDKNELHKVIGHTIVAVGYSYIPLGIMYLSKDMGFGKVNEALLKKVHIGFFAVIFLFCSIFLALVPFFKVKIVAGVVFNIVFVLIWSVGIYFYHDAYKPLKNITGNNCWLWIYVGIVANFLREFFNVLYFIVSDSLYIVLSIFQIIMALGYIIGFFLMRKMLKVE